MPTQQMSTAQAAGCTAVCRNLVFGRALFAHPPTYPPNTHPPAHLAGRGPHHEQRECHPLQQRQPALQAEPQQHAGTNNLEVAQDLVGGGVDVFEEEELRKEGRPARIHASWADR